MNEYIKKSIDVGVRERERERESPRKEHNASLSNLLHGRYLKGLHEKLDQSKPSSKHQMSMEIEVRHREFHQSARRVPASWKVKYTN